MKSFGAQTINATATDPEKLKKILSATKSFPLYNWQPRSI